MNARTMSASHHHGFKVATRSRATRTRFAEALALLLIVAAWAAIYVVVAPLPPAGHAQHRLNASHRPAGAA